MKAAFFAATLAAIATGVAALPAPAAAATPPDSLVVLRRAEQVQAEKQEAQDTQKQQDVQAQQQTAVPQQAEAQQQATTAQNSQQVASSQAVQQVSAAQYSCYDQAYHAFYHCGGSGPLYPDFYYYINGPYRCYDNGFFPCAFYDDYPRVFQGPPAQPPYFDPNVDYYDPIGKSGATIRNGKLQYLGGAGRLATPFGDIQLDGNKPKCTYNDKGEQQCVD